MFPPVLLSATRLVRQISQRDFQRSGIPAGPVLRLPRESLLISVVLKLRISVRLSLMS